MKRSWRGKRRKLEYKKLRKEQIEPRQEQLSKGDVKRRTVL
jgi:hypothetical protein